jgi:hypothetical protein
MPGIPSTATCKGAGVTGVFSRTAWMTSQRRLSSGSRPVKKESRCSGERLPVLEQEPDDKVEATSIDLTAACRELDDRTRAAENMTQRFTLFSTVSRCGQLEAAASRQHKAAVFFHLEQLAAAKLQQLLLWIIGHAGVQLGRGCGRKQAGQPRDVLGVDCRKRAHLALRDGGQQRRLVEKLQKRAQLKQLVGARGGKRLGAGARKRLLSQAANRCRAKDVRKHHVALCSVEENLAAGDDKIVPVKTSQKITLGRRAAYKGVTAVLKPDEPLGTAVTPLGKGRCMSSMTCVTSV